MSVDVILVHRGRRDPELNRSVKQLVALQNRDGGSPAFAGDEPRRGWIIVLAILSLTAAKSQTERPRWAIRWLLNARGREADWFWRWRFRTIDTNVRFEPAKYGWNRVPGTTRPDDPNSLQRDCTPASLEPSTKLLNRMNASRTYQNAL